MQAIQTVGLTKKYKDTVAVDRLDLTIEEGELFALLGVNGAGKTTTVKMLCSLVEPTAGEGYLHGKKVGSEEVKRLVALSPQETAVAPNLTVEENLLLLCGAYGFSKQKSREKTEEMLERFELTEIRDKRAGRLSGGWQRRLSIAMALVSEPKILFLDEPTLGLDVLARSDLWAQIRALKGQITVVLTTHYMEEAEALADRVGIMKAGRLVALGRVEELKAQTGKERFEDVFVAIVRGATV